MSTVHRDLELAGTADLVAIFKSVFTALSGGRELPTDASSTEHHAYSHESTTYLTAQGDGLTITEILDYGEWHHARYLSLVVGDITVADIGPPRRYTPEIVLRISASAARIDEVTETVKRIALVHDLAFVKQRDAT